MSSRQPAFKQPEAFAWESEPVDDRPVGFASSAFSHARRSSEFANSSFMDAAPERSTRRRKRSPARPRRVWTIALLLGLLLGLVGLLALLA